MSKIALAFALCVTPAFTTAQTVYQCKGADGTTVFSQTPCGNDAKKVPISAQTNAAENWEFVERDDSMTGSHTCGMRSPEAYAMGIAPHRMGFYPVDLRILKLGDRTLVALALSKLGKSGDSFHNDIGGIGVNVGGDFYSVHEKLNSTLLMFTDGDSSEIIEKLKSGATFKARIRIWPYDDTYDSPGRSHIRFDRAWKQLNACEARLKKN
jgi:hypothetical protein